MLGDIWKEALAVCTGGGVILNHRSDPCFTISHACMRTINEPGSLLSVRQPFISETCT